MRHLTSVPEGGCWASEVTTGYGKFGVILNDYTNELLGEGVTREWEFSYLDLGCHSRMQYATYHALTPEEAFDHFVSKHPDTEVKRVEFIGLYWLQ